MSVRRTLAQVQNSATELAAVGERIGRQFCRSEPWQRAVRYIQGLLGDTQRKNGWRLAVYLGARARKQNSFCHDSKVRHPTRGRTTHT